MNYKLGVFIILGCITLFTACKKEETTPTTTITESVPTGLLKFHLHTFIANIHGKLGVACLAEWFWPRPGRKPVSQSCPAMTAM